MPAHADVRQTSDNPFLSDSRECRTSFLNLHVDIYGQIGVLFLFLCFLFVLVFLFVYCLFISLLLLYVIVNKDYHRTVKVGGPASWGVSTQQVAQGPPCCQPGASRRCAATAVSALVLDHNCVYETLARRRRGRTDHLT